MIEAAWVKAHFTKVSMILSDVKSRRFQIPAKLYRIGEVIRYSTFSRQTIHNYTIMGLIRESQWTEGGHRLYDESVFERLSKIMELRKTKTLFEIMRILNKKDVASEAKAAKWQRHKAAK